MDDSSRRFGVHRVFHVFEPMCLQSFRYNYRIFLNVNVKNGELLVFYQMILNLKGSNE